MAVPARRGILTVTQPDGSTIQIIQHGDEHFHYITDINGQWLKQDETGRYVVTEALTEQQINARRMASPKLKAQIRRAQEAVQTEIPLNIAEHGLIILVNFKDLSFKSSNSLAAMQEMHSGDNYTYNGATGSARQYFYDQSMGKYNPQFDVVGPVTVSKNYSYYGANDSEGYDLYPAEMIIEACKLADSQFNVDFTLYDNNNDNEVDFVYVVYAGYGEADSEKSNTIWPHAWTLDEAEKSLTIDGKKINTYACSSELSYLGTREGIGTFCHEFSHVCGLPDLYATNNATHKTLGKWDILDYGPYNNDGNTPPAYSAYERFFCGWLTPTFINETSDLTLEDIKTSNKAYIFTTSGTPNLKGNDPNPATFYLLENRQQTGWDIGIPGHGMLLTKVAYSYNSWTENTVNNSKSNMGVDIIEADEYAPSYNVSSDDNLGKATDAFPAGATSYTKITNRSITNIKETNGVITFTFTVDAGTPDTPTPTDEMLTVAQALEIGKGLKTNVTTTDTTEVYGVITDIEDIDTNRGYATFTIADNTGSIYCYHLYNVGNKKFTSDNQIKVGDIVVIRSLIKHYKAKNSQTSIYELVKGYIKELNNTATGLDNQVAADYNLIANNGQIYITNPTGHNMHVINAIGQTLYSGPATTLTLPHGLYIVSIDNMPHKVRL